MEAMATERDFEAWKRWEKAENDRFREKKIPHNETVVLKVEVLKGENIWRDSRILNLFDTPNPQIKIEYSGAIGPKVFNTTSKVDNADPIWNESFAFVLPNDHDVNEETKNALKFTLIVEDWHSPRDPIGHAEYDPSRIQIGEEVVQRISFNEHGIISVKIAKRFAGQPNLRISFSLCDEEIEFRAKRMPRVMAGLQNMLPLEDAPRNLFETPIMSLLGSGGGLRAMVGMCGVMEGLSEIGLLDCLTYAFATSGSAWYISGAYAREALYGTRRKNYHAWLRRSFHKSSLWEAIKISNLTKCRKIVKEKGKHGQPFSLVDYWGICVTNKVIGKKYASVKLSDLRPYVKTADVPYPILNTVQAQDKVDVWKYHAACDFSPFECEMPNYGINIDTKLLNSEFYNGILTRKLPEPSLSFMVGALGSAFALRLSRILGIHQYEDADIIDNATNPKFFKEGETPENSSYWHSLMKWLTNLPQLLDRNFFVVRSALILNIVRGLSNLTRFAMNVIADGEADDTDEADGDTVDGLSHQDDTLSLIDGGLLCNVASGAALRPQRRNDILFVAEFTAYDADVSHETLESCVKLGKLEKYKFPYVDLEKIKREETKELYIFEDENDPECPIVFWFMPSTIKFREEKNFKPRNKKVIWQLDDHEKFTDFQVFGSEDYVTSETVYTDIEFERLRELMRYNIKIHAEEIKERIRRKIVNKRELLERKQR